MIQMPATYEYLFQLISASFSGSTPPEKPEDVAWNELFREAKRQNVLMLAYESIKRLQEKPNAEQLSRWELQSSKQITKSINQSIEIDKLLDYFECNGIDVLPLKGYILRDLYPRRELREMSDFDLLVRDDRSDKMKQIMHELGFEFHSSDDNHTGYRKPPYVMIELHYKLLPDFCKYISFRDGIWERCRLCNGKKHIYEMTTEDYLVFNLVHLVKHYRYAGCGIRFLVDIFAFLRKYDDQLNKDLFWEEIEKRELRSFAETVFCLERAVFHGETETKEAQQLLEHMISLGTFGSNKGRTMNIIDQLTPKNGNRKIGKLRYYLRIVFPPVSEMKCSYPVVEKAKFLLPVFWVCRGVRTVFRNPKHISEHYQRVMSYGDDKLSDNDYDR